MATTDADPIYTASEAELIASIAEEARALFLAGKQFPDTATLREEVRAFGHKKGFVISHDGCKLICSRATEPQHCTDRREQRAPVSIEKQRNQKSTRCGCLFKINFSRLKKTSKDNLIVKITESSNYEHSIQ